jgi:mannosyltransferase OCH1-like enzyme
MFTKPSLLLILSIIFSTSLFSLPSFDEASGGSVRGNRKKIAIYEELYEKNNYENAVYQDEPLIPKIIHQIWVGSELPEKFKKYVESWKKTHPDWEYKLWTDKDIDDFEFINKREFDLATNKGTKSDIWRYEILYKYGGVYLDTDYECKKKLDAIHHTCDFYGSFCDKDCIAGNGVIGCKAGHPIILACIKKISKLDKKKLDNPFMSTGPIMFTNSIMNYLINEKNKDNKIIIYPPIFFHPFPSKHRFSFWKNELASSFIDSFIVPETFAVHYWATSWQ